MSAIHIRLAGHGDCIVRHGPSSAEVTTSKSPQFGGSGASFSSTDLLGVALGTCVATDLEPVAERHGLSLDDISIEVDKSMSMSPKGIVSLRVVIRLPGSVDDVLLLKLRRAAATCLVQRSLHPDIDCPLDFYRDGRLESAGDG